MLAHQLQATALQWQREGRAATVVEVIQAQGSVPRGPGTRMLVAQDAVLGTIGGGHLELQAIAQARRLLPAPQPQEQRIALGPTLGQCCGGALVLRFTPLDLDKPLEWPLPAPRFHLDVYGAGHVGRAIVTLLTDIDCRVRWIDEREAEFPSKPLPSHIDLRCVEGIVGEVPSMPPGSHVLILTHSHDLDLALTEAVLRRGDAAWVGLIGSATKRARFEARLHAKGLDTARLTCPIGLPRIDGKSPAEIAIAVVAQLLLLTPKETADGHL